MDKYLLKAGPSGIRQERNEDKQSEDEVFVDTDTESEIEGENVPQKKLSGVKRKKLSFVWNYFKRSSDKKLAKCITCGKEYKTSGNTSNLADHLKRAHPISQRTERTNPDIKDSDKQSSCGSESFSSSARSSTRSVSPFFRKAIYYDSNSLRKKQVDRALVELVALDFQPFSIVNDTGFKRFVNLLDPRYELPSTYTLNKKLLTEYYLEIYTKLKNELAEAQYVSITCDSWTSVATESYLTVTCHYVNESFDLKSAVISTKPLTNGINHTAQNIADSLKTIFKEWDIEHKITCVVTDNASNMIKACEILNKRHLPCFAHTLNLAVQENFETVKHVIKKCKDIVTFFKSSTVAMETYMKEQNNDQNEHKDSKGYKLLQEVPTRWNSTYYMIERILKVNDAIGRAILKLRKAPSPLSVEEIAVLSDIAKVLKCFEEATRKVSGSNYVTISMIIPITFGIYNFLMQSLNEIMTEEGKTFCSGLIESVKKRLFHYENRTVTKIATILDPRFKKEGFRSQENAASAAIILEQEMHSIINKKDHEQAIHNTDVDKDTNGSKEKTSTLFAFLESRITQKSKSLTADIIITKRQYLERPNTNEEINPLLFCKISGNELAPMDNCCIKFMCIPATSVESERNFSATGQIISQRRSRLKPDVVNKLTFLHKNIFLQAV